MKSLVLTQPTYLPWLGMIDQLDFADVVCIYDSIPLPRTSGGRSRGFSTRVQILNGNNKSWLTIPIPKQTISQSTNISNINISSENWMKKHRKTIRHSYSHCKNYKEIDEKVLAPLFDTTHENINLNEFLLDGMTRILKCFNIKKEFHSSTNNIGTIQSNEKTEKLVRHCKHYGCDTYISGLGALSYINHDLFVANKIDVYYMDYTITPYEQGKEIDFDPYVTSIDYLVRKTEDSVHVNKSSLIHWSMMVSK